MPRRGIYDSDAVDRDDDDPFRPGERETGSRSMINWTNFSHALMPVTLRNLAISVDVRTNVETTRVGEQVGIRATLFNRFPFPVVLRTRSSLRWSWSVDGFPQASHVFDPESSGRPALLEFDRRERKVFERTWSGRFQESDDTWTAADPGEYEVAAWINVDDAADRGLRASTTVTVE